MGATTMGAASKATAATATKLLQSTATTVPTISTAISVAAATTAETATTEAAANQKGRIQVALQSQRSLLGAGHRPERFGLRGLECLSKGNVEIPPRHPTERNRCTKEAFRRAIQVDHRGLSENQNRTKGKEKALTNCHH